MSGALIATTVSAAATLAAQIATLQGDILAAGNLDNATVDQIATVSADAAAAILTAGSLEAAHESLLEMSAPGSLMAGGLAPAALLANFNQLLAASINEPIAFDTLNRLSRIQDNLDAIGT